VRQSVMHRGRWSQTNGWALWHHSSSTFFASHTYLYPFCKNFHPLWCSFFWLHGWLTGELLQLRFKDFFFFKQRCRFKLERAIFRLKKQDKSLFGL
jgi:hypothetical protein